MKHYDGLTEADMKNLEFLLNANREVLSQWSATVSEDDLDYAGELLEMMQLRIIDIIAAQDTNLTQAKEILSKYSLT